MANQINMPMLFINFFSVMPESYHSEIVYSRTKVITKEEFYLIFESQETQNRVFYSHWQEKAIWKHENWGFNSGLSGTIYLQIIILIFV